MKKRPAQFEKFAPKKSNAAIKEHFRQEKRKLKKEREEYFDEKKKEERSRKPVGGRKTEVRGKKFEDGRGKPNSGSRKSEVGSQKSGVRGQRSEVGSQKSGVRGQRSEPNSYRGGGQQFESKARKFENGQKPENRRKEDEGRKFGKRGQRSEDSSRKPEARSRKSEPDSYRVGGQRFEEREKPVGRSQRSDPDSYRDGGQQFEGRGRKFEGGQKTGNRDRRPGEGSRRPEGGRQGARSQKFEGKKPDSDNSKGRSRKPVSDSNRDNRRNTESTNTQDADAMPLNKYIAHCGVCSRRDAAELIREGNVKVNNETVTEPGHKVSSRDEIRLNGKKLFVAKDLVYILLNKPKDYITTTDDPQNRKTVLDLIRRATDARVYPVGRLDRNTSGVLLLTNDGELAQKLTHPSHEIKKVYAVTLDKPLEKAHFDQILKGVTLEDGAASVDVLAYADVKDKTQIGVEIHSGRNRIVRRIFEHLGYDVRNLDRVTFAGLTKKNVERGKWRFLSEKEIRDLKYFKKGK